MKYTVIMTFREYSISIFITLIERWKMDPNSLFANAYGSASIFSGPSSDAQQIYEYGKHGWSEKLLKELLSTRAMYGDIGLIGGVVNDSNPAFGKWDRADLSLLLTYIIRYSPFTTGTIDVVIDIIRRAAPAVKSKKYISAENSLTRLLNNVFGHGEHKKFHMKFGNRLASWINQLQ